MLVYKRSTGKTLAPELRPKMWLENALQHQRNAIQFQPRNEVRKILQYYLASNRRIAQINIEEYHHLDRKSTCVK